MQPAGIKIHALVASIFLGSVYLPAAVAQAQRPGSTLPAVYQKWLEEDVRYLISDQERSEFNQLETDRQRDAFVIAFWQRRNPSPLSATNSFKEEHYRRLSYANSFFADRLPGYKTDRGHVYIMYGRPDDVQKHSAAGSERLRQNGNGLPRFDWEVWHYSLIPGVGQDVDFKFVDTCGCGEYRIPVDDNDLKKYSPK